MGYANKEDERAYRRDYDLSRYHRRMTELREALGGRCVECGNENDLQIDHIDPKTKSFNISINWGKPKTTLMEELKKCQLLCRSCHKRKSDEEQRKHEHGTWGTYRNRRCRCDECRAFVSAYMREYRKRKRS